MISVNWGTRVITVPKSYLTLLSGTIYEMNVTTFRNDLKELEASELGLPHPDAHKNTTPVTLSGSTYARFVEIINNYTITFEDGNYQVNLKGANNNIVDVLNRNSVSVVANNSSGLIESALIEHSSFQDRVTVNALTGKPGTDFPLGTPTNPSNNIADSVLIANYRGIDVLYFTSDFPFSGGEDVGKLRMEGKDPASSTLTLHAGMSSTGTQFKSATLTGQLPNAVQFQRCHINGLVGTQGGPNDVHFYECLFQENGMTFPTTHTGGVTLNGCREDTHGDNPTFIDLNSSPAPLDFSGWIGDLELRNITHANQVTTIDMVSGHLIIDSSCTAGKITVRGVGLLTDNSTGTQVDSTGLIQPAPTAEEIADAVWDEPTSEHETAGTTGRKVKDNLTTDDFAGMNN